MALRSISWRLVGREDEGTVEGFPSLGIASQPEKRFAETPQNGDGSGIEALRLSEMLQRRIPASEALLGKRRSGDEGGLAGRNSQSLLVLLQGALVVHGDYPFVGAQRLVPLRAASERLRRPSPPPAGRDPPARRSGVLLAYRSEVAYETLAHACENPGSSATACS